MAHNDILLEAGTNEVEIVVFSIDEAENFQGHEYSWHFGVNVAKVLEIIQLPSFTEMPEAPHPAVLGAFNQRSQIIPLVDLGHWLGIPLRESNKAKTLVTEFNKIVTGFKVSAVDRIHRMSWERIEPPSRYVSKFSDDSITGVIKQDDQVVFLLDLEKIVAELNPHARMSIDRVDYVMGSEKHRALIADDSTLVRNLIISQLEQANYAVESAINGQVALEMLLEKKALAEKEKKSILHYLDVVVSDIEMPGMDGHSLTRRIKSDPVLQELPVILFSSLISDKLAHKGDAVGADLQVAKPDLGKVAHAAHDLIEANKKKRQV